MTKLALTQSELIQTGALLRAHIKKHKLSTLIQDKEYPFCDAWKYAGRQVGLVPVVHEPVKLSEKGDVAFLGYKKRKNSRGQEYESIEYISSLEPPKDDSNYSRIDKIPLYAYKCSVDLKILSTGEIIPCGYAMCTNMEKKKVTFDEYAICSMAQTRAIAKAFRNIIGDIMYEAGLEPTPAEEMDEKMDELDDWDISILDVKTAEDANAMIEQLKGVEDEQYKRSKFIRLKKHCESIGIVYQDKKFYKN
jgi:hypothetical protein